ncbi:hypothetical protein ACVWYH_010016 [Bradyrhizobium sp. GM24.11]
MPISEVRATVGRFVSIRCASSVIVAMITEVSCENLSSSDNLIAIASVDLLGEILNAADKAKFQRGVTNYPTIGDSVDLITSQELRTIYAPTGSDQINVGFLQQDRSVVAYVDIEEMLSKHFAVLGSTGVGKSTGVSLLLNEILKARPNLRIFLLDVHNEYGRCFGDRALVLNPRNLKLPFWLFNFEEIVDVLFGGRAGVPEELDVLAEVIPIAKGIYTQYQNTDRLGLKRIDPKQIGFTVDTPVPYRLVDLISLIDERMGKLENRSSRIIYHKLISRIEAVRNDPRYAFMFDNANVGGDTMAEVISHLFRLPAQWQADDGDATRRLPGGSHRFRCFGSLPHGLRFRPVERRRLADAVRLRGSAPLRLRRPQYRLRADPQGGVAHRQGRPQIRRLSRPDHAAPRGAGRHHHLPVQHAVHDAPCQRPRPGAAARRGIGCGCEPAVLRALARHP